MEITSLEQAQAVISLLTQQRESISNSYVLQVAEFQALASIAQAQAERLQTLEQLLRENNISLPEDSDNQENDNKPTPKRVRK